MTLFCTWQESDNPENKAIVKPPNSNSLPDWRAGSLVRSRGLPGRRRIESGIRCIPNKQKGRGQSRVTAGQASRSAMPMVVYPAFRRCLRPLSSSAGLMTQAFQWLEPFRMPWYMRMGTAMPLMVTLFTGGGTFLNRNRLAGAPNGCADTRNGCNMSFLLVCSKEIRRNFWSGLEM